MTSPVAYHDRKHTNSLGNIIIGIGSVVDLLGTQSLSQRVDFVNADNDWSDYDALKSDWLAIGNDMSQVIVGADMPEAEELFKKYYKAILEGEVSFDD